MKQVALSKDPGWLLVAQADVDAAGGDKEVGSSLWPHLDPVTAGRKLSNALNPKQKQELTYAEIRKVKRLARIAVGESQLHALESDELECDVRWRTAQDVVAMALTEFAKLNDRATQFQASLARSVELVSSLQSKVTHEPAFERRRFVREPRR